VHIWRLWSADDLQMSGYPAKVEAIAWDPTSRFLAVGSVGDVTIWDFSGRGPQGATPVVLDGFSRRLTVVRYQHRGRRLAAGSADGLIVVSEPTGHTLPIHVFGTGGAVSALEWSPDDTPPALRYRERRRRRDRRVGLSSNRTTDRLSVGADAPGRSQRMSP
jgi:WD40 repeat protein